MKVIVAGYPKTGTKSLNAALTILGYTVYDFIENQYYLYKDWNRIYENGVQLGDFERMYEGVDAVCDAPCSYYWKELSESFPQAKIVLMIRDEDSWYKSLLKQLEEMHWCWMWWALDSCCLSAISSRNYRYHTLKFLADVKPWPSAKLIPHNENTLKRMYREHNLYVQTTAPKDRLLVFKVTEGWKPLCDFLGVEIPDQPFPHKNKGASLMKEFRKTNEVVIKMEQEVKITLLVFVTVLAFVLYQCFRYVCS